MSRWIALLVLIVAVFPSFSAEGYRQPPQEVVDIVTAEPAPWVTFSPDHEWMAWVQRDALPSIADVSRRMLRLAGMRIDPVTNGRFRTSYDRGFEIRSVKTGELLTSVTLKGDEGLSGVTWSHDSNHVAFSVVSPQGTHLHTMRLDKPKDVKRHSRPLVALQGGYGFMPDGETILAHLVPRGRGAEPEPQTTPSGPNVQESYGNTSPTRTYQDLLANPYDESLFEHYATNQLALMSHDGTVRAIGDPGIRMASAAPDGKHLLVYTTKRPFSYLQAVWSFPQSIEVWDLDGKVLYTVADVPLAENIPIGGVRTGRRDVEWMANSAATLAWAEALDGGDPKKEVPHRDQLFTLAAPFDAEPAALLKVEHRSSGLSYLADSTKIISREYDRDRRWIRSLLHDLRKNGGDPKVLEDRSLRDRYGDPGSMIRQPNANGDWMPVQDGDWVYRTGRGASPKGNLPFIDRQNLVTLETERLWRCEEGTYESVVELVRSSERGKPKLITSSETPTTPPNYQLVDLAGGWARKLTDFPDPTPQIRGVKKQLVKYEREDGVPLSATLYLPADYVEGTKLPLLVWAYPVEFNDAKTAGQVTASPSRFTRIGGSSHLTMLTQGYAIMDGATMPVIGDPETMNDTFIEQIVGAAQAAIDKAVEMGVADGKHVGVGGHSYGAFMTANLLAHSDLFQAGVARSGAYNRTLTPFGFQSERRPLWEAKSVYFGISPFLHADKIKEPMLMIHGEKDNNSGTFPMQSRRMYQAIKGNGGNVRLVMLPEESHGYRALESVLHVQAEMIEWFDRFLKE
jgi:dipeptidyl aminopeptidase/acylaminoacyl peptidase